MGKWTWLSMQWVFVFFLFFFSGLSVAASSFSTDYCRYFPGALQTWKGNLNSKINLARQCVSQDAEQCTEWLYTNITQSENQRPLGFKDMNDSLVSQGLCNGSVCQFDREDETFHADKLPNLTWEPLFQPENSSGNFVVEEGQTYTPNLKTVNGKQGVYWNNVYAGDHFFALEVRGTLVLPPGEYWVDSLSISSTGNLKLEGHVILHVKTSLDMGGEVKNSENAQLTILGYREDTDPFENRRFDFDFRRGDFTGRIYAQGRVALSNGATIRGSITTSHIRMDSGATFIGESYCSSPAENWQLMLTPKTDKTLLCDRQKVQVQVLTELGDASDFSGQVQLTIKDNASQYRWFNAAENGSILSDTGSVVLTIRDGQGVAWLESDHVGSVEILANLLDKPMASAIAQYEFYPYGFSLAVSSDQDGIAGKPLPMTVTVKRCEDRLEPVVSSYSGVKKLRIQTDFLRPKENGVALKLKDHMGQWQEDQIELNFQQGKAETALLYLEAGEIAVSLSDPQYQPKTSFVLPNDWTGLEGNLTVPWRPWTLAICGDLLSGTANDGAGFVAAGAPFSLVVRPVIWSKTLSEVNSGFILSQAALCDLPMTKQFLSTEKDAPAAKVRLSSQQLQTPQGGSNAPLVGETARFNYQGLDFNGLAWPEVGSVWVASQSQRYLGMDINESRRPIGRFYPDHFSVVPSEGFLGENLGFAYLGEPLTGRVKVTANSAQGMPVKNYHLFDHKAAFQWQIQGKTEAESTLLQSRWRENANLSGWSWQSDRLGESTAIFSGSVCVLRHGDTRSHCDAPILDHQVTQPDGPFTLNLQVGVQVADLDDRDFAAEKNRTQQLPLRYGRARLKDVQGRFDQPLSVPFQVEYWTGFNFELNREDQATRVRATDNYCKQILWQDTSPTFVSQSTFEGEGQVTSGLLDGLFANPNRTDFYREQVRFWLRLDSNKADINQGEQITCVNSQPQAVFYPWLQYNWQNTGDTDPSAVITFGGMSGHHRILYRGERDLHTQTH